MKKKLEAIVILILAVGISFLFDSTVHGQTVTVDAIKVDNSFDQESDKKLGEAISMLRTIFNSEEFARSVLHARFPVANHQKSNVDIYHIILSGMDNYTGGQEDRAIKIKVKLFSKYFGYGNFGVTDMTTRVTRTHRCFVLRSDVKCYASHLAHEYMHQVGFIDRKRFYFFGKKTRSVPYIIGDIVNKLLENSHPCRAIDETCDGGLPSLSAR